MHVSGAKGNAVLKFLIVLSLLLCGSLSHAQNSDFGRVAFIPGWSESDGSLMAAIQIELNPGWKTYWRVPGAAGIPPNFNWTGSQNFRGAEVMYPTPKVETVGGLQSIGYHDEVVFPIRILPDLADTPVKVTLLFTFGACLEICVPVEQQFSLTLDPKSDNNRALIQSALDLRPTTATSAGVISAECSVRPDGKDFLLLANIKMNRLPGGVLVAVFELQGTDYWVDVAKTKLVGNSIIAEAPLQFYGDGGFVLQRSQIRLTLLGTGTAVDIQGCPA